MKFWNLVIGICLLLFCSGCKKQADKATVNATTKSFRKEYDVKAEVVITGRIINREVYPQQRKIRLKIPGYGVSYHKKTAEIDNKGNFSFRFSPYGIRDIAIETFVPYLIVRPGDSLHVEIDFKHLSNVRFSGTAGKINNDLFAFTDKGYYIEPYSNGVHFEWGQMGFTDEVRRLCKDLEERKNAYLRKYHPEPEVLTWINQTLDIDFYKVMLVYPWKHASKTKQKMIYNEEWYAGFIKQVEKLYHGKIANSKLHELTAVYWVYLSLKLNQTEPGFDKLPDIRPYIERMLVSVENSVLREYLIAMLFNYLLLNNGKFQENLDLLNTYLTLPPLKYPLLEAWQIKCKNACSLP